jgi:phage FluMu protein Com
MITLTDVRELLVKADKLSLELIRVAAHAEELSLTPVGRSLIRTRMTRLIRETNQLIEAVRPPRCAQCNKDTDVEGRHLVTGEVRCPRCPRCLTNPINAAGQCSGAANCGWQEGENI